jgi:hypothetical protein
VDGRSDVFSLGSVLYELAAGRGPFDADRPEDVLQLMTNIVTRPHQPASRFNPHVPPALDAIVNRALAKDPARRFPGADAMALELRALLARELRPAPGEPGIAQLAERADVLLPGFDLFAEPGPGEASTLPLAPPPAAAPATAGGSLLERLRSQAEALEITGGADDTATATLMRRFDVERRMRSGWAFYQELVRYLGVVKPELAYEYRLEGIGAFPRPRVADAFVDQRQRRDAGRAWTESLLLTLVAVAATRPQVACAPGEANAILERLAAANLRYESEAPPEDGAATTLTVAGEITAVIRIMADRERGRIAFLCRNVGGFGTASYVVDAAAVDDSVFEEFANHLLGQPNRFLQLAGRA